MRLQPGIYRVVDRVRTTKLEPTDMGFINPNVGIGWGSIGEPPATQSLEVKHRPIGTTKWEYVLVFKDL